jgi:hypothetical protein
VPRFCMASRRVRNLEVHPSGYDQLDKVWLDRA